MGNVTGSYLIAKTLKEEGVEVLFYLMGGPNFDISARPGRPFGEWSKKGSDIVWDRKSVLKIPADSSRRNIERSHRGPF